MANLISMSAAFGAAIAMPSLKELLLSTNQ